MSLPPLDKARSQLGIGKRFKCIVKVSFSEWAGFELPDFKPKNLMRIFTHFQEEL